MIWHGGGGLLRLSAAGGDEDGLQLGLISSIHLSCTVPCQVGETKTGRRAENMTINALKREILVILLILSFIKAADAEALRPRYLVALTTRQMSLK